MRINKLFYPLLSASLLAAPGVASFAADTFKLDPAHTHFFFMVNHLGYSNMIGQFHKFDGQFTVDQGDWTKGKVELSIKTDSVDTDHDKRNEHLRSPDFFNAAEFPEMKFVSTKIEKTGEKTGKVTGDFTLLGVTKPVTLDFTLNQIAPHPLPQYNKILTAGFSVRGKIKRSDFGMKYAVPAVADDIDLIIEMEGAKQ
ncbi:MAG: YceI family protein [Gammaproteobacteria bacterium]